MNPSTPTTPHHSLTEMIGSVAVRQGLAKSTVAEVVDAFLEQVGKSALEGDRIVLRGFGSFYLTNHTNRTGGVNQRVAFKAGASLRKKAF
jgi:nucleoid DNA-binding protein